MIRQMKTTIVIFAAYFTLYLASVVFHSDFWSNILSPVGTLLSGAVIFLAIHKQKSKELKQYWMFMGLACLSWAAADVLWAIYDLILRKDPNNSDVIQYLYYGATAFLFITAYLYLYKKYKKWDTVQLLLDAIAMSLTVLWLLWAIVFDKQTEKLGMLMNNDVVNTVSIATDMVLLVGIMVWYLSVRGGRIPIYLRLISGAFFLYTAVDLCYFYLYMIDRYIPNSMIDACYIAAFLLLAAGVQMTPLNETLHEGTESCSNIGFKHKGWLLFIAPLLVIIFKGADYPDILIFIVIILIHGSLSNYIQESIHDKALLQMEQDINRQLEAHISERAKDIIQKNDELQYVTTHDALTGLHNRLYFIEALEKKLETLGPKEKLVLLYWDIDRLTSINDTYGHTTGDQVLIALAGRVRNAFDAPKMLARLGGDEFVMAVAGSYPKPEIEAVAQKIVAVCREPIRIGQYALQVGISIGVSMIPDDTRSINALLSNADIAMNYVKNQKESESVSFYDQISQKEQQKHLIESFLQKADYDREFRLFYQPQFTIAGRKLIGMEALLRWNCPEAGYIPPDEFIPIAEEADIIIPIGNWVIQKATGQISEWNRAYGRNLKVSINISARQLIQTDFFKIFSQNMSRYHTKAEWIDVEITEGVALAGDAKAEELKAFFQSRGGSISIDDFGTGYSSLGSLKKLAFDRIKIAKPLVDSIASDEFDRKIIFSIIMLAKSLGIQTIAEGVETREQFELLSGLGCDEIQGFYLGRPVPPEQFEQTFLQQTDLPQALSEAQAAAGSMTERQ